MSCEQVHALLEGFGRFNRRRYGSGQSSGGDSSPTPSKFDDIPDMTPEQEAQLAKRMGIKPHGRKQQ